MTLIAAFPLYGVPILIGDLLVTSDADANAPSFLPTSPEAAGKLPAEIGVRISGSRKKVHFIGSNLAVAWSGSQLAASYVIGRLYEAFSSTDATIPVLTSYLAQITEYQEELFRVHIIGWVVDPEPMCFRWNSMWPSELFIDNSHFDGTGEDMFSEALKVQPHRAGMGHGISSPTERAIYVVLAKAARLIDREIWDGEPLRKRFGYCYEIAFFDGSMFRYVEQISYLNWEIAREPIRGDFLYRLHPTLIKYQNMGEYSIVQTHHHEDGKATNTYLDLIQPVHNMIAFDNKLLSRQPFQSTYYCNFIRYRISPTQIVASSFVSHCSDHTFMGHDIRDGKDLFFLNMGNIELALGITHPPSEPFA